MVESFPTIALDGAWTVERAYGHTHLLLRPGRWEASRMVRDVCRAVRGHREAAILLGVGIMNLRDWLRRGVPGASVRGVWATWIAVCHPGRVRTIFDWVTWGRFRRVRRKVRTVGVKVRKW